MLTLMVVVIVVAILASAAMVAIIGPSAMDAELGVVERVILFLANKMQDAWAWIKGKMTKSP